MKKIILKPREEFVLEENNNRYRIYFKSKNDCVVIVLNSMKQPVLTFSNDYESSTKISDMLILYCEKTCVVEYREVNVFGKDCN